MNIKINENLIQLPSYMMSLPQSFIEILGEYEEEKIVSCGIDPSDHGLYFITSKTMVGMINPSSGRKPLDAFPSWNGDKIYVSFDDDLGIQGLDTSLVLRNCSNVLRSGTLHVGDRYVCDVNIEEHEKTSKKNDQPDTNIHP